MGNGLMAQPTVRQLAAAHPQAELRVFARNGSIAGVFDRLPEVASVEVFGNEARQFGRLLQAIRRFRADLCVIPYPSNRWQYSLLARACGARRTIVHRYRVGRRRSPGRSVETVEAVLGRHDVLSNLDLLRPLGTEPDETMRPAFPLDAEEVARARLRVEDPQLSGLDKSLVAQEVAAGPRPAVGAVGICAIHAGSGNTIFALSKRWPPEQWAALLPRLRDELNVAPILLEGPEDAGVGELIRSHVEVPVLQLAGPLAEAAAVLAACDLYVGSDSGLAHLAAAVGTPPVTLFGPARPDEVCPFGYRDLVVQTPAACAPCFLYPQESTSPRVACRPPYCIGQIAPDRVLDAARLALEQPAS